MKCFLAFFLLSFYCHCYSLWDTSRRRKKKLTGGIQCKRCEKTCVVLMLVLVFMDVEKRIGTNESKN